MTTMVRVFRAAPRVETVCVNQPIARCRSGSERAWVTVWWIIDDDPVGMLTLPTPPTDVAILQPPAAVSMRVIRPERPVENCFIESFSGKLRDGCLSQSWFLSLGEVPTDRFETNASTPNCSYGIDDARRKLEAWRLHYNTQRPYSSLKDPTPPDRGVYLEAR